MFKRISAVFIAAAVLTLALAGSAFAITQEDIDAHTGPGSGITAEQYLASLGLTQADVKGSGLTPTTITAGDDGVEYGTRGVLVGSFNATGYCNCTKCCGKYAGGKTYSGTLPKANHTVAADIKVLPIGTKIMIGDSNIVYTVEDIGSGVNNNHVDIFFTTHQEAEDYGWKTVNIYLVQ